ncbi:Heat stress transcription factor B-4 [Hibiscus syriacus]|uniref:Heat stress transcription factor B-4 n=1 Tax=Hibiscus syriacus TaxID=106335 RepID=A0A6A3BRT9_HIBSY|nr:heat stress transcription factor B-4-like [Hibiscus syriacus]KAE8718128.1 Heat stress transcription factor B-4 [Hibiscus syriacus]
MALMLDNCEGILLSLDSHKSVPAPFLTKTYQLVDDPTTDHIVSWGEDDTTFVVWRPPEFARDLLPNYFKHNNFSSFVRQLNTYGFRKIVPDRWEFANEFFKKGEKHLLCEIHRRKTAQPQVGINHHHHHPPHSQLLNAPSFFPFPTRVSISPPDSDEQANWCDSPPVSSPGGDIVISVVGVGGVGGYNSCSVTALSEDNEKLRKRNSVLVSELAHMKKLYSDIIYFVQNHVKPVTPSNSYSPSMLLYGPPSSFPPPVINTTNNSSLLQKPSNHHLGHYYPNSTLSRMQVLNSTTATSQSSLTILEEACSNSCKTKLFGVPLQSKKRVHPEYGATNTETTKARLVLEKDDLRLNLMPPAC